ncbi:NAD-P-binding protein [Cylindrobasidium torrendii FP15055 ss-10]|uniref:NAD-P-binding protein n=1 Tax=Cylindrobasidium torrendii FP15055 ss-10 TaxID=1314674 RepID=A0A0D7B5C1_9AGAR|nr:NAD-P-binding protein [Cylindrobasidium torrendii FP15055 ss-10]
MAPTRNAAVIFNQVPTGYPEPGKTTVYDTTRTIDLDNVSLDGGVLLKIIVLSNDPYLRGKMYDARGVSSTLGAPDVYALYASPFHLGEPLSNYGVGRVLRSEDARLRVGDHVTGVLNFEEYAVVGRSSVSGLRKLENKENLSWSAYVGAAGMTGRTAYYAYHEYAKAKKGDNIFVSSGAGAVGSQVIQLAKLDGLKVIGSAGSDDKVAYMKDIGADVAFNYKTTSTEDVLKKEGPLDVYWDNVGGSTLDSALGHMKVNGRLLECGMISAYNTKEPYAFKNIMRIVSFSLSVHGFVELGLADKWEEEFYREYPALIASGKIKYREERSPFSQAGEAILRVQMGDNVAKSVIVVEED